LERKGLTKQIENTVFHFVKTKFIKIQTLLVVSQKFRCQFQLRRNDVVAVAITVVAAVFI